ncbi:hypothetical protein K492DRAFT_211943 [Lichtheimia hyalospora FSU 10163]|nr:hypothetical protein K492DRAFT_211943 [Lichtheimia hyalospora FSU 10163]
MSGLSPAINKNKRRFKPTTSITKRHKKNQQPVRSDRVNAEITNTQQQQVVDTGNEPSNTLEDIEREHVSSKETKPEAPVQKPPLDSDAVLSIIRAHVQQQSQKRKPKPQGVSKDVLKQQAEIKRRMLEQEEQEKKVREQENSEGQGAAPQVTMVNGEIVLDPSSLEYSAPSIPPHEIVEVVHEGNESLIDKSVRRTRKNVVKPWTQQEEELLYELLKEHGLSFHKISQYIPGRDAKSVQKKYNKESKLNPLKLAEASPPPPPSL